MTQEVFEGTENRINLDNVDKRIEEYLKTIQGIKLPITQGDVLKTIHSIKRDPLGTGPYPKVSLFETANRIFSDLVILFGVRSLLTSPLVGEVSLPFREYSVALGVQGGPDLSASQNDSNLVGEAFHVAPSFFQTKKRLEMKKLRNEVATYRIILFNHDAVKNPEGYLDKSEPTMLYLPVNIWELKDEFWFRSQ